MPCKFSMIFYGIFEDFRHKEHSRRGKHLATRVQGAPLPRGPMVASLHLFPQPHTPSSQKNHQPAQTQVLAHFAVIFDLLVQNSIHKTALGDYCLVCDSSNGLISFCSSALFCKFLLPR